ncbi:unnamed protein product [Owenia fusiformis]|uniref:Flavin-containing monooxygenase n=1 Tax=Owenia fusiformis TaxID=6347 RepID=A0A8J1Y201_OWEFU|nr:unnamed protein product [Owenia fusiformis]
MAKKVAILGAGASGLTAIKSCNDEGLAPVCFERTNDIGGLWNFTEEVREDQACVAKSTVINTSKEMMCYSDFIIPKEYPNFMHNTYVQKYFRLYADKFNLLKHIKFRTEVTSVKKADDFAKTGQWQLHIKDLNNNAETVEIYDAVLICTGHHADINIPKMPGLENFKGRIIHSHDYKDLRGYEDKNIVIVGIGNSGGDAAVELSRVAKQVYLSTRRGSWVLNRVGSAGVPQDLIFTKRVNELLKDLLPISWVNSVAESIIEKRFDHEKYSLRPNHRFYSQHPMVNDDLPNRIICGAIQIRPDIDHFTVNGVKFVDGTEVEADVVFLATGYKFGFPFLDDSVLDVHDNHVDLYKYAWAPDLEHPTLAVIGCIQPWGAINPIAELQCRWAAAVFKGDIQLPPREEMCEDIKKKKEDMSERYVKSQRHTIQVDWIPFMDEIAEQAQCKPDLWKLFKEDPRCALNCLFGPCTPYQYRLQGRKPWSGAKDAINTQWERVYAPLKTRPTGNDAGGESRLKTFIFQMLLFMVIVFLYKMFM